MTTKNITTVKAEKLRYNTVNQSLSPKKENSCFAQKLKSPCSNLSTVASIVQVTVCKAQLCSINFQCRQNYNKVN